MTGSYKISLKVFFITCVVTALCCAITWKTEARGIYNFDIYSTLTLLQDTTPLRKDTIPEKNRKDSATTITDSLVTQLKTDTFSLKISKDTLDAAVEYEAEDSAVVLITGKKIILYGQTRTTYNEIILTAPTVTLDQQTNILMALANRDSLGRIDTRAHFEQAENKFDSDTILFNFKTQRGLTKNTFTQQQEMYVQGEEVKKVDANTFFVSRGRFTTCNLDVPHFAFRTNKLKVVNNKVAISGPTHPEFENVPVPLYLPFGFFPMSQGRHSGFLPPQFTVNEDFGLGLEGLGYYKVLNDYFDITLRGNLYSYGGWNMNLTPTYRKRYRYNGTMNFSLQHTKFNFKGDPDYNLVKTFFINWSHSVDPRARPGTSFSANVNAGSTRYNRFIPNSPNRNFQNQLSSSIAYSKTWAGKPYNLTLSANHNQNNNTRLVNLILPDAGFTVNTIYPFQRKEFVGSPKWYEKLGVGYNGTMRNQLSFYDTGNIKLQNMLDTLQWGAQHRFPITVSLPPIGPFLVAPSVSYEEVWLTQKFRRVWNPNAKRIDTTIEKGIYTDRQVTFGAGVNTSLYGTMQFKDSRVIALRHVVRPNISFNYRPDLSRAHYYSAQVDTSGRKARFTEFEGNLFSGFSEGRFGGISFGVDNNLEMKWRSKKDTGENAIKKIRLIDGFGFTSGYNFLSDSLKLQNFNLYLRSTLFEKLNLTASAQLTPYQTDIYGLPVNRYAWQGGNLKFGQITYGTVALSTSFQSKSKDDKPKEDPQATAADINALNSPNIYADYNDQQRLMDYMRRNPAEFVDFSVQWQLSLSFSLNFNRRPKPDYSGFTTELNSNISFNNSFNLTPKWNFSTNGYLDVKTGDLQTFTMSISRDMHCWQMSIGVTPIGPYRYFNFTINPKASILQDLKVNRTRYFYNY